MEEFELDHRDFTEENRYRHDDRLYVRFFMKPQQDMARSEAEGRPIFADTEFVQILVPGDKQNIVIRPVGEQDRRRFAKRYEHWLASGRGEQIVGTPLEMWPGISASLIEEMKYFGIRSVEQMAELRDDIAGKYPGFNSLKQRAQEYLSKMSSQEKESDRAKLEQALAELADLRRQVHNGVQSAPQGDEGGEEVAASLQPPTEVPSRPARRRRKQAVKAQ